MSTRALIGKENPNNTITSVYCHHDGYPVNGVGEILTKHYNSIEDINALLALGCLSSLKETLEDSCFYIRDRKGKEHSNSAITDYKAIEFAQNCKHSGADYAYVYKNNGWYFTSRASGFKAFTNLTEYLKHNKN